MYKIAVMGDRDSIYGFAALGLEIFPTEQAADAADLLRTLSRSNYAVIYITEGLAAKIPEVLEPYQDLLSPAIILIPGIVGNTGMGQRQVKRAVEKAVGSDIIN